MEEHVAARCGEYALLFPAENIEHIAPVPPQVAFVQRRGGRPAGELVIDLRRLLGVEDPRAESECVMLGWRSTDDARRATLLVDSVDAIVNCHPGDLVEAPLLPARLRPYCTEVLPDPRGGLRLRVKPDVKITLQRREDRRRFVQSLRMRRERGAGAAS